MRQNTWGQGTVRQGRRGAAVGVAVLLSALVLAACGSSDSASDATTTTTKPKAASTTTDPKATTTTEETAMTVTPGITSLSGSFISSEVTGYDLVEDSQITMTFDGDQLSVNAGCNTLGSTYSLEENVLKWTGEPRATMMACSDALMAQDTWLTELLTTGVDTTTPDEGTTLVLATSDVKITLEAVAEAPITGTTWTLESTTANDASSSLPADVEPPTLTIDEDGNAAVFTGCNSGSTTVDVADTTLTFGPLALTKMACPGGGTQLEAQVVAVLDGEVAYTIDGDTLTLVNDGKGLVYQAS